MRHAFFPFVTNESFKKWKWPKGTKSRMYETMTSQYGRTATTPLASKDMTRNVCVLLDFVFANKKKKTRSSSFFVFHQNDLYFEPLI